MIAPPANNMKTALFHNFTQDDFTGYWDGKPKTIKSGEKLYMPDYLAKHFAKHLTNRELLKRGQNTKVSPKKPNEVPEFMELFNKACIMEETHEEMGSNKDDIDTLIDVANKNRESYEEMKKKAQQPQDPTQPQYVIPPDDDEDDFEGAPVEKPKAKPKAKSKSKAKK